MLSVAGLAWLSPFDDWRRAAAVNAGARRAAPRALFADGRPPDRQRPIGGKKRSEEERDGYVLETWDLDLNGIETVPAYLARPARPRAARRRSSSIIRTAAATPSARQELLEGRPYLQPVPYAKVLTDLGYIGALHRSLGVRRAQPHHRARHVQGDAVEGPGAVGHDGVRQPAGARLARRAAGCRHRAHRHARHVDGQHDGVVARRRSTSG